MKASASTFPRTLRALTRFWRPLLLGVTVASSVYGWDYEGHRTVNLLAADSLPASFPSWIKDPAVRERLAFLGGEPDRWRNVSETPLRHINAPDHFIDLEDLEPLDLTTEEVSDLRVKFVEQAARARQAHPERFREAKPEKDQDGTRGSTGYLPWATAEAYYKVKSAFSYLKALEENGTPSEIENARANAIVYMGLLGHYVGDATQPLHTTKHFNGWQGENPGHYTTSHKFHQWIDGGFLSRTGGISETELATRIEPARALARIQSTDTRDPIFSSSLLFIKEEHEKVERLYQMDRDQYLSPKSSKSAEGRAFLEGQLLLAGNRLGSLWLTAWQEAPIDTYLRAQLLKRKLKASDSSE